MTVRKTLKWFFAIVVFAGLLGGGYGYYLWTNANKLLLAEVREKVAEIAPGWDVKIGSARFDWNRRIHLYDVTLTLQGDSSPALILPEVVLVVDREKLADDQEIDIQRVHFLNPEIRLVRDPHGVWNWEKLPPLKPTQNKPSLPECVIESATVHVTLAQASGLPPGTLRIHDADLKLVPSAQRSYLIEASAQVQRAGRISTTGRWNVDAKTWSFKGRIHQITSSGELLGLAMGISPELRQNIAKLQTTLRRFTPTKERTTAAVKGDPLPDLGISGTLDVGFQLSRSGAKSEMEFQLDADITDGRIVNPALPFPLHDITGKVSWTNERVLIRNLRAKNGTTRLFIDGEIQRGDGDDGTPCRFDVKVQNLPLDDRLRARLPASWQRDYDRFQPTGRIDLAGSLSYDGRKHWTPSGFVLTFKNCTAAHVDFPYPVRRIYGTVTQQADRLAVQLRGMTGRQPASISGYTRGLSPSSAAQFDLIVHGMSADDTFLAACKPDMRRTLKSLGLRATFDAHYRFSRKAGENRKFRHQIIADVKSGSILYDRFPYPVTGLTGRMTFDSADNIWRFSNFRAKNGSARFFAEGTVAKIDDRSLVQMSVTTKSAHFDKQLRQALPPPLKKLWDEVSPQGKLEMAAKVRWHDGQPARISFSHVQINDGSLLLKAFPYPWKKVQAKLSYSDGVVTIHSLRGKHNETSFSGNGFIESWPNGEWRMRLVKFYADDVLPDRHFRLALSKNLRSIVETLNPRKPISVSGMLELRGTGDRRDAVTAAWDLKFVMSGNALYLGTELKSVHGRVTARGTWDGKTVTMREGNLIDLDSATAMGYQFTQIRGPFRIVGKEIIIGSADALRPVTPGRPARKLRLENRLTARAVGGDFTLDAVVQFRKETVYRVLLTMNKARLEQYASRYLPGAQNLAGVMYGRLDLTGRGSSSRTITGHGKLLISPAALYELPVLAQMFKLMNFVPPDKTAFRFAFADFKVANNQFLFNKIDLVGDGISLRGRGTARFDGRLAVDFYSMMPTNQFSIPFIRQLVNTAANGWVGVEVRGTKSRPITRIKPVPQLDDALKRFLGAFGTRPARRPIPLITPSRPRPRTTSTRPATRRPLRRR
ncbi:MAG: hypothetical protein IID45_02930 [Planctomycetes bacterium]|nr:hypothetical protein [Planctomycetota bacterium]